jgi:Tfp pilus assembly pilus retraction ATPase PilT
MKYVDEDSDRYLCASRTKLRQDARCDVIVVDDMMELETIELVLDLENFQAVGIHVFLVAIPRLVDLVDDHCGVAVDQ